MIICALLLAGMLSGCASKEEIKTDEESVTTAQTEPPVVQTEQPTVQTEGISHVTVSTPYGDLYSQDQWADLMKTEQKADGESVVVSFSTEINGTAYPLFHISIGSGDGALVGELTDAEGTKREVYAYMETITESPELTSAEQNRLYAMQEDINYIIDNLE